MKSLSILKLSLIAVVTFAQSTVCFARTSSESTLKPAIELHDIVAPEDFEKLNAVDQATLVTELNEFNKNPYVQVADNSDRLFGKAFCVGGKFVIQVIGLQGLKCVTTTKKIILITQNNDSTPATAGMYADGWMGLNVGISLIAGVALLSAPASEFSWTGTFKRASHDSIEGGSINGAFFLKGGYFAYFNRGDAHLSIVAYQAGFAIEFSASSVQITN